MRRSVPLRWWGKKLRLRSRRSFRFCVDDTSGRQPGVQGSLHPFLDAGFNPRQKKTTGIRVQRWFDGNSAIASGARHRCQRFCAPLGPKRIEVNPGLPGLEFERFQARPLYYLDRIRDCRAQSSPFLTPFEVVDALRVNLDATANADSIAQPAIGLAHDGAEPPALAGPNLLEYVDLWSVARAVHTAWHGRDCLSFSKLAQTSAAKWTPQWTPNQRFCGHHGGHHGGKSLILKGLVPKKGLEPPHPCEYMDLNHARLPIPPLRHGTQIQHLPLNRQQSRVSQN